MPSTFLPRQESKLDAWLANFAETISGAPDAFGLSPADATKIADAVAAWHAAYVVAQAPSTRTISAVSAKNEQKRIVLPLVRRYATIIRANPDVPSYAQIGLGLHPPRLPGERASRIPTPQDAPQLSIRELEVGSHTVRIMRGGESPAKARPKGAAGLLLFRAVADAPTMDRDDARFLAFVTRSEFLSEFARGPENRGKFATYFARWTNFKGELGPWSTGVSMQIAA